ncbi:2-dehydropantoate 2-reductase [Sphingomonas bacterium]|uniref:2-dehydropantoate 2-reductase n=1 Tax=Sphingomonas bacterium TaxID=1895847 RepID=UPI0026176234|nr:2-dehydropantoate 2-reductase [Sphingomonas bacterium]MDB5678279.1 2-dehydropantoate 2-reductase [Sphingomonas bacterium]
MRIAIAGAGAIGGWMGVRLARSGQQVSVVARGNTLAALRSGPWWLETAGETVEASVAAAEDAAELGEQDVVVIAVKGPALARLAPRLRPLIGEDTVVVPAMNGIPWWFLLAGGGELPAMPLSSIDPDGIIAEALPFDRVIGSVVHGSVTAPAPGRVVHKAGNGLILGEPVGQRSERLDRVADAFAAAGFDVTRSGSIRQDIWYKLWGNMTMNPISAFTGATCDRILDDPLVNRFVLAVMAEAREVGSRIGCPIGERGEDRNQVTRKLGAFKTSMLQDAEAGRALEIDQIAAAPAEIASALGIAVPNIETLLGLVRLFGQARGLYTQA